MTLHEKIAQARLLAERATPGKWQQHGMTWNPTMGHYFARLTAGDPPSNDKYSRPITVGYLQLNDNDYRPYDKDVQEDLPMQENAEFIAASRELVPALAEALAIAVSALEGYAAGWTGPVGNHAEHHERIYSEARAKCAREALREIGKKMGVEG